jgi:death-on-curing protein
VAKRLREPRWLSPVVVDSVHSDQLKEHGGLPGIRGQNVLESALARPKHRWAYAEARDFATLAASYGFGLIMNHPYRDGSKRIGFLAMATFLGINGRELKAADTDVVTEMIAVASGRVSEEELGEWIRDRITKP